MSLTPQRLRRLVRYRERLERLQEMELASAQRLYHVRLDALEAAHGDCERTLDQPVPRVGPVDTAELMSRVDYLGRAKREISARQAALAHSEDDVSEERAALLDKRRDRKAMEALLDHRLAADRLEANRAETRRIDEMAVTRWRPREDGDV